MQGLGLQVKRGRPSVPDQVLSGLVRCQIAIVLLGNAAVYGRLYRDGGDREYIPHRRLHMGWEPIAEGATPGVVCDPFAGTGTVGEAALKMGRSFVGCELYPNHVATAARAAPKPRTMS